MIAGGKEQNGDCGMATELTGMGVVVSALLGLLETCLIFLGLRLSFSFIPVFSVAVLWTSLSILTGAFLNFCFPFLVRACILISDYRLSHMTDPERGTDMVSVNEWRARKMNTEERSYDAVIFDLDGTLLDTLTDLADSLNAVLQLHDLPLHTKDEVRRFVGNGIRKLIERAIPGGTGHPQYEQIYQDFCTYYGEHCMDATEPYPGVPSLLDWLKKAGYQTAIVSNKADFAVKKLNRIYFEGMIPVAIGEREGIRKKPAPDTVFQALRELGVEAQHAVYVGDSDVDLETAANAGMDVIPVCWGFRSREFLIEHGAVSERIVSNVRELREQITAKQIVQK